MIHLDLVLLKGTSSQTKEEVEKSIATDLGREWELKDGKLVKSFQFSSFMNAINFVNEIAKIAERLDHHPIITINWKSVKSP